MVPIGVEPYEGPLALTASKGRAPELSATLQAKSNLVSIKLLDRAAGAAVARLTLRERALDRACRRASA
jgi:ethanolamine utilization microcompartment shell protein EutS